MASGSSGRPNSGSKAFDFGSNDILCSYEDYGNQESSNGTHTDLSVANSSKVSCVTRVFCVRLWIYGCSRDNYRRVPRLGFVVNGVI